MSPSKPPSSPPSRPLLGGEQLLTPADGQERRGTRYLHGVRAGMGITLSALIAMTPDDGLGSPEWAERSLLVCVAMAASALCMLF